jgi:diaminopimelate decarboxylase
MDWFRYVDGQLYGENVDLDWLAATVGTPVYVYSRRTFEEHYRRFHAAFRDLDPLVCYSIKACGNIHLCRLLGECGAGADVVSGGELYRAQLACIPMNKVVFAGVAKSDAEIRQAIEVGVGWLNIESEEEFANVARIARDMDALVRAALRVNPDVYDPKTHAKTTTGKRETKFGVDIGRVMEFFSRFGGNEHCRIEAIHMHLGSPVHTPQPYVAAIRKGLDLIEDLRENGHAIGTINIGGGFAAEHETNTSPSFEEYAEAIVPLLRDRGLRVVPSRGEYARLLDIGRTHIERLSPRSLGERLKRLLLCRVLPYPRRLRPHVARRPVPPAASASHPAPAHPGALSVGRLAGPTPCPTGTLVRGLCAAPCSRRVSTPRRLGYWIGLGSACCRRNGAAVP